MSRSNTPRPFVVIGLCLALGFTVASAPGQTVTLTMPAPGAPGMRILQVAGPPNSAYAIVISNFLQEQVLGGVAFHVGLNLLYATSTVPGFMGTLDAAGGATIILNVPPGLPPGGVPMHAQAFLINPLSAGSPACSALVRSPLLETFDTDANRDTTSGFIGWAGTGSVDATFPSDIIGDGSDGAFAPVANTTLDTNQTIIVGGQTQSRMGIFNFTSVTVPAGVTVRVVGPYACHIRCLGSVVIDGTLDASAGANAAAVLGTPEQGARAGLQNNGGGANCEAPGGVGNAGAGDGGRGSPGACTVRAPAGERGFGPRVNGLPDPGNPPSSTYAGGEGGIEGCFPVVGPSCQIGDLGGLGGAGGTGATSGENGVPRQNTVACGPVLGVVQPIAQAFPVPAVLVPPIATQSAGSGGGGGGDHIETTGVPPANDDQGGGGGGGGGSIRITCLGSYVQGPSGSGGLISCAGARGAIGSTLAGSGGSGSGGEVWIQSFSTITFATNSVINIDGPPRVSPASGLAGCSNQAAGGGGDGVLQLEAGVGTPITPVLVAGGGVVSTLPFQSSTSVIGTARSKFVFAGFEGPDYTTPTETTGLGNAAGASITIRYEGAPLDFSSPPGSPHPDLTAVKSQATGGGPITAANIDELDGYPFIRFVIRISYAAPPANTATTVLPHVDAILININEPAGVCQ